MRGQSPMMMKTNQSNQDKKKTEKKQEEFKEIKEIKKEPEEIEEEVPKARFDFETGHVAPILRPREVPEEKARLEEMLVGIEAPEKEEKKEIGKYEKITRRAGDYVAPRKEDQGIEYVELKRVMPQAETIRSPMLHGEISADMRRMERPEIKYDSGNEELERPFREREKRARKYKGVQLM
jgi:hypothetical protein